jgi:predicted AAA+ superfamily ATPase
MGFFWEKQDWEAEDQHLCALAQAPFRRRFPTVRIGKGLQSIRGPRQIGKSSWLKTLLSEEVRQGKKCFFMSCEELHDDRELSEVLRTVKNRDVLFLDEISFVSQWDRSIKYLLDNGFRGSLLITGSNMFDLRAGIDRMPGRWAKGGGEYYLWPMDFSEWMQVRQEAGWSVSTDRVENLHLYFRVGGFPTSVIEAGAEAKNQLMRCKTISDGSRETFVGKGGRRYMQGSSWDSWL